MMNKKYRTMKHILFYLLIWTLATCCSTSESDRSKANIELVNKYLNAVKNRDYATMRFILDDRYVGFGPSIEDTTYKDQALKSWKWNSENLYESITFEESVVLPAYVKEGESAGEWVSNWSRLTIRYKDGRGPVDLFVNAVYKIEQGKIIRSRTFYNEADVYAQLGYRIFPPLNAPEIVKK